MPEGMGLNSYPLYNTKKMLLNKIFPNTYEFIDVQCYQKNRYMLFISDVHIDSIHCDRDKKPRKDPEVLTVDQARRLLEVAEETDKGIAGIVALKVFGGLRPEEAKYVTHEDIDWKNGEILIKRHISKTRRSRTYDLISPLREWLAAYPALDKVNHRKRFEQVRIKAGFSVSKEDTSGERWAADVCRHTAITFRLAREKYAYGFCAALFGNSEQVIKDHYQAFKRPSQDEVDRFYGILPKARAEEPSKAEKGAK